MMWRITNFIQFLKDLVYWVPKIWQDRDWDPTYLYQFMRWKIERMAKHMAKAERHTTWKRDVRNMKICIALLKRAESDDTYDDMFNIFNKSKCPDCKMGEKEEDELGFLTKAMEMCDSCSKTFKREHKWLRAKEKSDRAYLFKILDKEADRWWT